MFLRSMFRDENIHRVVFTTELGISRSCPSSINKVDNCTLTSEIVMLSPVVVIPAK